MYGELEKLTERHLTARKKENVLIGGQTWHVWMSEYTEPITEVFWLNKFYACTNLVKFIFKSFVSCILQFQAFYI